MAFREEDSRKTLANKRKIREYVGEEDVLHGIHISSAILSQEQYSEFLPKNPRKRGEGKDPQTFLRSPSTLKPRMTETG